jgi:hypothetical protein
MKYSTANKNKKSSVSGFMVLNEQNKIESKVYSKNYKERCKPHFQNKFTF